MQGPKGDKGDKGDTGLTGAGYSVDYVTVSDVSNAFNCNLNSESAKNFALAITNTTAKTITFTNVPTGRSEIFLEIVTTAAPGAIAWTLKSGSTLKWATGSAPALDDGKVYRFMFYTSNGGSAWQGYVSVPI